MSKLAPATFLVSLVVAGASPGSSRTPTGFDWPQWQGADRDAKSKETGLLKAWPAEGPALVWKATGLGMAHGTPSIAAGRIFAMGNREKDEAVVCLDESTGKELWAATLGKGKGGGDDPGPRCTPTVDGEVLYALGRGGALVCLQTSDGKEVWRREMRKDFGGRVGGWEYSESPLVDGDRLIVTPGGTSATLAAMNKKTGATVWQSAIPDDLHAEYSSIIAADVQGTRQYIQFLNRCVVGVAAADGRFLWSFAKPANKTANCSTPIYSEDHVFAASAYGNGGGLARLSKDGDLFRADEVYFTKKMKNHHGGMVLVDGYLYGSDEGQLTCMEWKTGVVKWQARQPGKGSICYADGHLYYRNEGGKGSVFLVEANPEKYLEAGRFDPAERTKLPSWAHPVIANGKLYLRDQDVLLCYLVRADH
ncbi:MAG TPA: PQQ-binding-like beta-propeller repeat protein [Planctomycetota bacterium]|nr:PQQ-binding-like beta-propeller repeat protein [Planctomycetota bacterium]